MNCRVCSSLLTEVLDLGNQCLGGQFHGPGEPDPPRFPLVLCSCAKCGLIQLRDTVDRTLMFGTGYGYRSGVTETMRKHLEGIAKQACELLGREPKAVMDIGGNDGTLLEAVPISRMRKLGIDPASDPDNPAACWVRGFFPDCFKGKTWPFVVSPSRGFDLIFSIACFYDADDPVAFARAVRDNLTDDGIWCCEVSDATAMMTGAWDGICHEHLCYYTPNEFFDTMLRAGLRGCAAELNTCNGGSIRFWFTKTEPPIVRRIGGAWDFEEFRHLVTRSADSIKCAMQTYRQENLKVHLLGASTKANTWLQYCGITPDFIQYASDRDPRKHGRRTPGTNIPIISEEESRDMKPDVYVVGPWHFREEVIAREQAFVQRGGTLVFPLPKLEEVRL